MYHIKNDKRVAQSVELIYDGLSKLLKQKEFSKITVTELQKQTSVSRATIYRSFDGLIDVLNYASDAAFKSVFERCAKTMEQGDSFSCIKTYFDWWTANSLILEQLASINRKDILIGSFIKYYHVITQKYLPDMTPKNKNYLMFAALRAGIGVFILTMWVEEGKKRTSEELVDFLKHEIYALRENYLIL